MRRKAALDELVVLHQDTTTYGTVVDYVAGEAGPYRIVQTDSLGRYPVGRARHMGSERFAVFTPRRYGHKPGRIYRANMKTGGSRMRGCSCQCCPHVRGYDEGQ